MVWMCMTIFLVSMMMWLEVNDKMVKSHCKGTLTICYFLNAISAITNLSMIAFLSMTYPF